MKVILEEYGSFLLSLCVAIVAVSVILTTKERFIEVSRAFISVLTCSGT